MTLHSFPISFPGHKLSVDAKPPSLFSKVLKARFLFQTGWTIAMKSCKVHHAIRNSGLSQVTSWEWFCKKNTHATADCSASRRMENFLHTYKPMNS